MQIQTVWEAEMDVNTYIAVEGDKASTSWNVAQEDLSEASIEDIHQIPELLLEDVERILFSSDHNLYATKEDREHHHYQPPDNFSGFKFLDCQELSFTYNITEKESKIKLEELNIPAENENLDTQLHVKHGVLNINIKKIIEEENMRSMMTNNGHSYPSTSRQTSKRPWSERSPFLPDSTSKILLTKEERPGHPRCHICTKPALAFSSYGGQACSSCRSFFRRSASRGAVYTCKHFQTCKISPTTRKNCQHCRFQLCLKVGMHTTWVLSEEEKQRRFKKLKKEKIPSMLDLPFSNLEENILQKFNFTADIPWLKNFFVMNKDAGVSLIEYAYGNNKFSRRAWGVFEKSKSLDLIRHILPTLEELEDLSPHDLGQIMRGHNSGIANLYRLAYWLDIGSSTRLITCPVAAEMRSLARDQNLVKSLELEGLISRLDLSKEPSETRRPSYSDLYPAGWGPDSQEELVHREALTKIVHWPIDHNNKFDYRMACLLLFIIVFNADFYTLENKKRVEDIQMKFTMILQRYLRSRMPYDVASTKFIEAMLLISLTQQAFEITYSANKQM